MQTLKKIIIIVGLVTGGCASVPELTGGEIARREVVTETPCEGGVCRITERAIRASAPRTRGASAESADIGGITDTLRHHHRRRKSYPCARTQSS